MSFVNVRELHNRTSEILRRVMGGYPVFVTRRGKPIALIHGLTKEDLEDLVLLHHPQFQEGLEEALGDVRAGRGFPLRAAISGAQLRALAQAPANGPMPTKLL